MKYTFSPSIPFTSTRKSRASADDVVTRSIHLAIATLLRDSYSPDVTVSAVWCGKKAIIYTDDTLDKSVEEVAEDILDAATSDANGFSTTLEFVVTSGSESFRFFVRPAEV